MNTVLVVSHQIGGARAVGPVVRQIQSSGRTIITLGYDHSAAGFRQQGIECQTPAELGTPPGPLPEMARAILNQVRPGAVLSGTSAGETLEKVIVREARAANIPTVSVLDHWSNYAARFAGPEGPWHFLPDRLAVMDTLARDDLLHLGCPAERLVVTGQPYFDDLPTLLTAAQPAKLRSRLGVLEAETLLVFASEPQGRDHGLALNYTEIDSLRVLLESVAELPRVRWRVLVRPHPTEDRSALAAEMQRHAVQLDWAPDWPPRDLMLAADGIIGMTSMFLVEAALLGCVVISLQPGLAGADQFIGQRLGLTLPAYDGLMAEAWLAECGPLDEELRLRRARSRWPSLQVDGAAAWRVADVLKQHV